MKRQDFIKACDLAFSKESLSEVDDTVLHGCACFDFKPVVAPIRAVAKMIRDNCQCFNGEIDTVELNNLQTVFRNKVTMI